MPSEANESNGPTRAGFTRSDRANRRCDAIVKVASRRNAPRHRHVPVPNATSFRS